MAPSPAPLRPPLRSFPSTSGDSDAIRSASLSPRSPKPPTHLPPLKLSSHSGAFLPPSSCHLLSIRSPPPRHPLPELLSSKRTPMAASPPAVMPHASPPALPRTVTARRPAKWRTQHNLCAPSVRRYVRPARTRCEFTWPTDLRSVQCSKPNDVGPRRKTTAT